MLEKKQTIINNTVEKLKDYYNFIHNSDTKPKQLKKKIKETVKKSLKKRLITYNRNKTRTKKISR